MRAISFTLATALLATVLPAQTTADAVTLFQKGEYAQAQQMLEKTASGDATARTMLALSRAATGGCNIATDELRQQTAGNPDATLRRLAGIALVQCQLAANRVEEAWPVLTQLQKSFPDDADVLYETAKVHMKAWNDAVFQMYQKTPGSYRVNQLSGEIFEIQANYPEAIAEYRKAIEKNPIGLNLHYRLARALLLESHDPASLEAARKEFEEELKLNPSDAVAEYQVGQILLAQQKPGDALARLNKAVTLNPDFAEALVALAKMKSEAKQYEEAIPLLERAVKLQPMSESAHYSLMLAYRNGGRMEDAQREKEAMDKLTKPVEGEFTDFLKKLGEKTPTK